LLFLLGVVVVHAKPSILTAQAGTAKSLTLPEAIDLALRNNRDLQLAGLDVTDTEHLKKIARAAYFPKIKNESTVLHVTELAGVVIPAGAFGNPSITGRIPGHSLTIDQGELTTYTSGTGLTQPITQLFKIHASNRAVAADVETAKIKLTQAQDEIALRVRQLYYGILIAQLKQQAAEEQVQAAVQHDQESQSDVQRGAALETAALGSRAELLSAQQTVLTAKLQVDDLMLNFNNLLGVPLGTHFHLDGNSVSSSSDIPLRAEGLHLAKDQSPEILAARQAVVKAKAGAAASRDAYIPDLTGIARYSYQSGVPLLVHNFGTFGVSLSYELFDGGKRNEQIRHSQTLLNEAVVNLAKLNENLEVQVNAAYDKVEQAEGMLGVARKVMDLRTEAARVADRQFEKSSILLSEKIHAHAMVAEANASLAEATLRLSLAQNEVKQIIGQMPR